MAGNKINFETRLLSSADKTTVFYKVEEFENSYGTLYAKLTRNTKKNDLFI